MLVTSAICGRSSAHDAVRLVGLGDEQLSTARAGVSAKLRHVAADEPRRIEAEPGRGVGDHRRRRGLPVGPPTQIDRRAATISARSSARWIPEAASPASSTSSASAGPRRRRRRPSPRQMRAVVALGHMDPEPLEPAGVLRRRRIAAVDLGTPGIGDRASADMPAPPMPTMCRRRSAKPVTRELQERRRDPLGGIGRASRRAATDIAAVAQARRGGSSPRSRAGPR